MNQDTEKRLAKALGSVDAARDMAAQFQTADTAGPTTPGTEDLFDSSQVANGIALLGSGLALSFIAATTEPADDLLVNGQIVFWLDHTHGAAKFKIKAKDASGTVVNGSVTLTP